jgi:hypothetical protein
VKPAHWLRRLAWRVLGEPPQFGSYVEPRRLPKEALSSWEVSWGGHRVNGMDRLIGSSSSYSAIECDYPDCLGSVQELAFVDGQPLLLCRAHFTPVSAVIAFESRPALRRGERM